MIEASRTQEANRRLRYGMVGGGEGSFIGDVHRRAIRFDDQAELTAGCFSRSLAKTLSTGAALNIDKSRLYESYTEMAYEEAKHDSGIDFVVIVTPNSSHYSIARTFLEQGIHVVCDKPLTTGSAEARELMELAKEKDLLFGITYTYTGYPAVKEIRNLIQQGTIGKITFVNAEYPQDWLAEPLEKSGENKQAAWRTDPAQSGISNCVGDIGSHMENMVSYMTDLKIKRLSARLDIMVEGRQLDDNATIMVDYENRAKGIYWCSQIAWGSDNALQVRIFGEKGSVTWNQEDPNHFQLAVAGEPVKTLSRGRDAFSEHPNSLVRVPAGHPEGYFEAFANIYKTYTGALRKKKNGEALTSSDMDFPQLEKGYEGVIFIEKCVESSKKEAAWVNML